MTMKPRPQSQRKFTQAQVKKIRNLREGGMTLRALARRFGVSTTTIIRILDHSTYKNVL